MFPGSTLGVVTVGLARNTWRHSLPLSGAWIAQAPVAPLAPSDALASFRRLVISLVRCFRKSQLTLSINGFWQYGRPERHGAWRVLCWLPSQSLQRPQLPQMRFGKKLNSPAPIDEPTKVSGKTFIFSFITKN